MNSRKLNIEDLVLQIVFQNTEEENAEKHDANWEGPYRVTHVVYPVVYELKTLGGAPVLRS